MWVSVLVSAWGNQDFHHFPSAIKRSEIQVWKFRKKTLLCFPLLRHWILKFMNAPSLLHKGPLTFRRSLNVTFSTCTNSVPCAVVAGVKCEVIHFHLSIRSAQFEGRMPPNARNWTQATHFHLGIGPQNEGITSLMAAKYQMFWMLLWWSDSGIHASECGICRFPLRRSHSANVAFAWMQHLWCANAYI